MVVQVTRLGEQSAEFGAAFRKLSDLVTDMQSISEGARPEELAGAEAPLLDRWILGSRLIPCLVGLSTGHPLLPGEDRAIGTSDLWLLSDDRTWARTLSRWYRLGRPAGHVDLHS